MERLLPYKKSKREIKQPYVKSPIIGMEKISGRFGCEIEIICNISP